MEYIYILICYIGYTGRWKCWWSNCADFGKSCSVVFSDT